MCIPCIHGIIDFTSCRSLLIQQRKELSLLFCSRRELHVMSEILIVTIYVTQVITGCLFCASQSPSSHPVGNLEFLKIKMFFCFFSPKFQLLENPEFSTIHAMQVITGCLFCASQSPSSHPVGNLEFLKIKMFFCFISPKFQLLENPEFSTIHAMQEPCRIKISLNRKRKQ